VAFIGAATGAIVSVVEPIEGGERMSGASYSCDGAIIKKTGILPGGDKPYAPARPCLLMGAGLENAPSQYATRGDVDRVLGEIAGLRGAADATAQKLAAMLTEATQRQAGEDHRLAEIEGRLARRQEERSQRLVALIAALGATVDKRYAAAERRRNLDDRSRAEADDRRGAETEQRFRDAADAMATLRAELRADTRQASMETEGLRQDHAAAEADLRSRQRRDRTRIAFIGGGIILAVLAICALGYFRLWMELKRLMSGTSAPRH
jgi:hypothetical protein